MQQQAIERAAQILLEARRSGRPIKGLPEDCRPGGVEEAYRVQAAFRRQWKDSLAGWKIGATAKPIQERFGVTEPFRGPIYRANVHGSPARLEAAKFNQLAIESEFAYRLGRDLPPRVGGYKREEIIEAVDAIMPAFEIVSCRYEALPLNDAAAAIADCGVNGAEVLGKPVTGWRGLDIPRQAVRLYVDGQLKAEGNGSAALGDPRNVLEWVVNKLSAEGVGLEKGQVFSTGTCTGVVILTPGQTAVADFGSIGKVELTFV
jgi:2-keto-4-pentenoate hydratase